MATATGERVRRLRKLGILPNEKIRPSYSKTERDRINRAWKKYSEIALAPPGEFRKQSIKHLGPQSRKNLKASGIHIVGDSAIMPTLGAKKVSTKIKQVPGSDGNLIPVIEVRREYDKGKTATTIIGAPGETLYLRERLYQEWKALKFGEYDYIGLQSFEHGRWRNHVITSLDDAVKLLYQYQSRDREFRDPKRTDYIINNTHLVKLHIASPKQLDTMIKSDADYAKASKHKKKSRKLTGTKIKHGKKKN
jgi:hypothetical protein